MTAKMFFVLGATDPEMERIAERLSANGLPFGQATHGGKPVRAGNAYEAAGVEVHSEAPEALQCTPDVFDQVVLVECDGQALRALLGKLPGNPTIIKADHHNEGDPGFGKKPDAFWEGSSIGQVFDLIGETPNDEDRLIAAADHCPNAAYRGLCPGVDPEDMWVMRIANRAARHGLTFKHMETIVEQTAGELFTLATVRGTRDGWLDLRDRKPLPEAPEASASLGMPILSRVTDVQYDSNGNRIKRSKDVLLNATPTAIKRFMKAAKDNGQEVYGNPFRGYAGAYLTDSISERSS